MMNRSDTVARSFIPEGERHSYLDKMREELTQQHMKMAEQTIRGVVEHKDKEINELKNIIKEKEKIIDDLLKKQKDKL